MGEDESEHLCIDNVLTFQKMTKTGRQRKNKEKYYNI